MSLTVVSTSDEIAALGADAFVTAANAAVAARGRFVVALSGGSTPKKMHGLLAATDRRDQVEWDKVWFLFGDERYVPPSHEQSNERMARQTLLSLVPVVEEQILGMYSEGGPEAAADRYEAQVRNLLGEEAAIDLTYLGLGPDAHTASLFPGRPSVHETERLVVAAKANMGIEDRITMTVPLLNRSREVLFLAGGEDKEDAVYRAIEGPENWDETPSQAVARYASNVRWVIDSAAAAKL